MKTRFIVGLSFLTKNPFQITKRVKQSIYQKYNE